MQARAYRPTLDGKDVLAKSLTGSGKTLSFMVPLTQRLLSAPPPPGDGISVLVLSPVRELATQLSAAGLKLCAGTGLGVHTVIGGGGDNGVRDLRPGGKRIDILVATPTTLLKALAADPGAARRLAAARTLVIDEADQLLGPGFQSQVGELVNKYLPQGVQLLMYSATMSKETILAIPFIKRPGIEVIDTVGDKDVSVSNVTQSAHVVETGAQPAAAASLLLRHAQQQQQQKGGGSHGRFSDLPGLDPRLLEALRCWKAGSEKEAQPQPGWRAIVFIPTNALVELIAGMLQASPAVRAAGITVVGINGGMAQNQRNRASEAFRLTGRSVLVTSDASKLGMDYAGVTMVMQLGFTNRAAYVQRVGRTARAGATGEGVLLVDPAERPALALVADLVKETPLTFDAGAVAYPANPKALKGAYRSWLGSLASVYKALKYPPASVIDWAKRFAVSLGQTVDDATLMSKLKIKSLGPGAPAVPAAVPLVRSRSRSKPVAPLPVAPPIKLPSRSRSRPASAFQRSAPSDPPPPISSLSKSAPLRAAAAAAAGGRGK